MNREKRYQILSLFERKIKNPTIELIYSSSFELLIAVILSAQSTDLMVNKTTKILFKVANTPQKILNLGFDRLKLYIKNIGLYNIKAKNIIKTSFLLIKHFHGIIPSQRAKLESFPGVGRKTANILLNILFQKKTIAVDTHVFRVCNRTNFAKGNSVILVEKKLLRVVPVIFKLNCHAWFVLHGRYICTARKLKCHFCIIFQYCEFNKKIF